MRQTKEPLCWGWGVNSKVEYSLSNTRRTQVSTFKKHNIAPIKTSWELKNYIKNSGYIENTQIDCTLRHVRNEHKGFEVKAYHHSH